MTAYWGLRAMGWERVCGSGRPCTGGRVRRPASGAAAGAGVDGAGRSKLGGRPDAAPSGSVNRVCSATGFFIVLREQADLQPAAAIVDLTERRAWVYQTLVAQAEATPTPLLAWLEARALPYRRYYLVNGIAVQANAWRRRRVQRLPGVERVLLIRWLRPAPALAPRGMAMPSRPTIGAGT